MTIRKKLRFFLDSEFNEHARANTLDPISIALVPEDETQPDIYRVSSDFDESAITPWLADNVVKHLPPRDKRHSNADIAKDIAEYLKGFADVDKDTDTDVEIWALNGSSDNVVLANLFGGLMNLSKAFNDAGLKSPKFRDLNELKRATGEKLPPPENAHDCYVDALWAREMFKYLVSKLTPERKFLVD